MEIVQGDESLQGARLQKAFDLEIDLEIDLCRRGTRNFITNCNSSSSSSST
jgi:hypothetical protein